MTKGQMIKAVQLKEAEAWLEFVKCKAECGMDSDLTSRARTRWVAMNEMMSGMGIEQDVKLPQVDEAFRIGGIKK